MGARTRLRAWVREFFRTDAAAAVRLGVSPAYFSRVLKGSRGVGLGLGAAIEDATRTWPEDRAARERRARAGDDVEPTAILAGDWLDEDVERELAETA